MGLGQRSFRRRGWWAGAIGLGLATLVAGGVARMSRDPWPPRLVIAPPAGASGDLWLAGDGRSVVFGLGAGGAAARDLATGRPRPLPPGPPVRWLASAPGGRGSLGYRDLPDAAAAADDSEVVWVDAASGSIRARFAAPAGFRDLAPALGNDGRSIRVGFGVHYAIDRIATCDLASGRVTSRPEPDHADLGNCRAYSGEAGLMAYFPDGSDGIRLWDVVADRPHGALLRTPGRPVDRDSAALFTPDGGTLLVIRPDGRAESWDVAAGRLVAVVEHEVAGLDPDSWEIAADGRTLLAASFAPAWDDSRLARLGGWLGGWSPYRPDDRRDTAVIDRATGQLLAAARLHPRSLFGGRRFPEGGPHFAPDGRSILVERDDGSIAVHAIPAATGRGEGRR